MPVTKKRNESTETRLLLEADEPVELPAADVDESRVLVQFDAFKPYLPELVEALRAGTVAEPVPVMLDGSTFVIHGSTRSFWVKLWHSSPERTRIERAQVISCLPSTRGVQVFIADDEDDDEYDEEYYAEDEYAEDESDDDDDDDDEMADDDDDETADDGMAGDGTADDESRVDETGRA